MSERKITDLEQKIIKFIIEYYTKTKFYPNYDEIADGVDRHSKSVIHTHMRKLEDMGIIIRKTEFSPQYRLANADFIIANGGLKQEGTF